jgi:hypothetical protein
MASKQEHPISVRIGQVEYHITSDQDEWLKIEHKTQTKDYFGHTANVPAIIYLNPEAAPSVTRLTLWHEVLHAVFEAAMGAPSWDGLGKDKDEREESVIRLLEAPTLNVLADNPDLVAYLTGR